VGGGKPLLLKFMIQGPKVKRFGGILGIGALLFVIAGSLIIYWSLHVERRRLQTHAEEQLRSIATLKMDQIANWRAERLADARFFSTARFAAEDTLAFLQNPADARRESAMIEWMSQLKGGDRYLRVLLFDTNAELRLAVPPATNRNFAALHAAIAHTLQSGETVITDLEMDAKADAPRLHVLLPLRAPDPDGGTSTNAPIAALVLRLDPHQFLYPLIQSWPIPSETAEALLVRPGNNDLLVLNDLRYQTNAALRLRLPLAGTNTLPAQVEQRANDIVRGRDYRGVEVVGAVRPIPQSQWTLVAKMDRAEFFRPLRSQTIGMLVIMVVVGLTGIVPVSIMLRRAHLQQLRQELALERSARIQAERYEHLMNNAGDIILLADENLNIVEANHRAVETYGYSEAELRTKRLPDLRDPADHITIPEMTARLLSGNNSTYQARHCRRDGISFPVDVNARVIEVGGEKHVLSVIRDSSERVAREAALMDSQLQLQAIVDQAGSHIFVKDLEGRYLLANRQLAEFFGCPPEAILGRTAHDFMALGTANIHRANDLDALNRREAVSREEAADGLAGQRTFLSVKFPLLDAAGIIYALGGIATDITERKENEERLHRQAEALLAHNETLARFNQVIVGRELRMIELKREINQLHRELGRPEPFAGDVEDVVISGHAAANTPA
jgi:PAS domain S-box-containing protein